MIPLVLASPFLIMLSRMGRNAASVFPVPVGDIRSAFLPFMTSGDSFICGSVGETKPLSWSALVSAGENSWNTLASLT